MLLVEDLDALGAHVDDARRRAARLHAMGRRVTWLAVAPRNGHGLEDEPEGEPNRISREGCGPKLVALAAQKWERVILASAIEGGGPLSRWLPRDARWWPTGWAAEGEAQTWSRMAHRARGERSLDPLDGAAAGGVAWILGWSEVDPPASRRPGLPLWDGDLVLSPGGLDGLHGREIVTAFAQVAESWSGVDLVSWGHPGPELERRARTSGIGMRVHHVGPAPRLAESSWLSQAAAIVLQGGERTSSALVLRALVAGCPLLWVGPTGPAADVARWLADRGCAWIVRPDPSSIASNLEALLERGADVEAMLSRGRELATRHDRAAVLERVASAIGATASDRRAA